MKYYKDSDGNVYQLQRCPFCGMDVAEMYSTKEDFEMSFGKEFDGVNKFTIVCNFNRNGCGATCGYHDTIDEAVSRWNTRVVI